MRSDARALIEDPEAFGDFVGDLFRTRRKQIGTILGRANVPEGIDAALRPEQLDPAALLAMYRAMRASRD